VTNKGKDPVVVMMASTAGWIYKSILDLDTRWMSLASLTPWPLFSSERAPGTNLI